MSVNRFGRSLKWMGKHRFRRFPTELHKSQLAERKRLTAAKHAEWRRLHPVEAAIEDAAVAAMQVLSRNLCADLYGDGTDTGSRVRGLESLINEHEEASEGPEDTRS